MSVIKRIQPITRIEHSVFKPFSTAANLAAGTAVGIFIGIGCLIPVLGIMLWLILMVLSPLIGAIK